uniref:Uncharacterized protein n=1 Tax=Rhizophora mucronata TaxID=61149 RepID=A0A2P2L4C2_RHIMU
MKLFCYFLLEFGHWIEVTYTSFVKKRGETLCFSVLVTNRVTELPLN